MKGAITMAESTDEHRDNKIQLSDILRLSYKEKKQLLDIINEWRNKKCL